MPKLDENVGQNCESPKYFDYFGKSSKMRIEAKIVKIVVKNI